MTGPILRVIIQAEPFDEAAELARLRESSAGIGAVVSFLGLCRDEGGRLSALEIEAYPEMAEAELARIAAEAAGRSSVVALTVIHRFGTVVPGEAIVFVAAASAHRSDAFATAEFVMDVLKTDAPFWKREHRVDGTIGPWLEAKPSDAERARRWSLK